MMLAVHELEEIVIGDKTQWDISSDEKLKLGHNAIEMVLKDLLKKEEIKNLILEFDARETADAKFAHWCDKLECELQCKLYDLENCVDLTEQEKNNHVLRDPYVRELFQTKKTWSSMWLEFGRNKYGYDENFTEVSNYADAHDISKVLK